MVNKPKAKGTAAETRVVNYLLAAGFQARRAVMKGSHDEGDIHVVDQHGWGAFVLEVKAGKQTQRVGRKLKEEWLHQTRVETVNSKFPIGYLVIAKHGSSVKDYEVWSEDGHSFFYLDQFVELMKEVY